jgi:succinate dehydrogenase flavin-adding protein (antitoxin of CptAB toxin-antitoxin module)
MMTPIMMRQLWALVESTQVSTLLNFNDSDLVQLLVKQLVAKQAIDEQTMHTINNYVHAKLPLIRDTAEGRQSVMRKI